MATTRNFPFLMVDLRKAEQWHCDPPHRAQLVDGAETDTTLLSKLLAALPLPSKQSVSEARNTTAEHLTCECCMAFSDVFLIFRDLLLCERYRPKLESSSEKVTDDSFFDENGSKSRTSSSLVVLYNLLLDGIRTNEKINQKGADMLAESCGDCANKCILEITRKKVGGNKRKIHPHPQSASRCSQTVYSLMEPHLSSSHEIPSVEQFFAVISCCVFFQNTNRSLTRSGRQYYHDRLNENAIDLIPPNVSVLMLAAAHGSSAVVEELYQCSLSQSSLSMPVAFSPSSVISTHNDQRSNSRESFFIRYPVTDEPLLDIFSFPEPVTGLMFCHVVAMYCLDTDESGFDNSCSFGLTEDGDNDHASPSESLPASAALLNMVLASHRKKAPPGQEHCSTITSALTVPLKGGRTPFLCACDTGNVNVLRWFLSQQNKHMNKIEQVERGFAYPTDNLLYDTSKGGWSPLHHIVNGMLQSLMLKQKKACNKDKDGADIHEGDADSSPFLGAAQLILSQARMHDKYRSNREPDEAPPNQQRDESLSGQNEQAHDISTSIIMYRDKCGRTALLLAVKHPKLFPLLQLIFDYTPSKNLESFNFPCTGINQHRGDFYSAPFLAELLAPVLQPDNVGFTTLHSACLFHCEEKIIRMLVGRANAIIRHTNYVFVCNGKESNAKITHKTVGGSLSNLLGAPPALCEYLFCNVTDHHGLCVAACVRQYMEHNRDVHIDNQSSSEHQNWKRLLLDACCDMQNIHNLLSPSLTERKEERSLSLMSGTQPTFAQGGGKFNVSDTTGKRQQRELFIKSAAQQLLKFNNATRKRNRAMEHEGQLRHEPRLSIVLLLDDVKLGLRAMRAGTHSKDHATPTSLLESPTSVFAACANDLLSLILELQRHNDSNQCECAEHNTADDQPTIQDRHHSHDVLIIVPNPDPAVCRSIEEEAAGIRQNAETFSEDAYKKERITSGSVTLLTRECDLATMLNDMTPQDLQNVVCSMQSTATQQGNSTWNMDFRHQGSFLGAVWLDFCGHIDKESIRHDIASLFRCILLRQMVACGLNDTRGGGSQIINEPNSIHCKAKGKGASKTYISDRSAVDEEYCLAFTFSWRGAAIFRTGSVYDGPALLTRYAEVILPEALVSIMQQQINEVHQNFQSLQREKQPSCSTKDEKDPRIAYQYVNSQQQQKGTVPAVRVDASLTPTVSFRQYGQLFFGIYKLRARVELLFEKTSDS